MPTQQKVLIDRSPQFDIFSGLTEKLSDPAEPTSKPGKSVSERRFIALEPSDITLGNTYLKEHLKQAGQQQPLIVASLLDELDWSAFEQRYSTVGRPPYAPRNMMGLILYGIMQGITSLRTLERLARLDLGCMWVSGGIFPDHANIGRFITLHGESLTGEFFESLTRSVLRKTDSGSGCLAGDGTVIEAACSHYNLLKEEAAKTAVAEARKNSQKAPQDKAKKAALDNAIRAEETLLERKARRKAQGKPSKTVEVSPTEPESMVQKMKRGRGFASSYTPSVLANEKRVVVGQAVNPTSEIIVVPEMLDQSERIAGQLPDDLLLDAGYFTSDIIATTLDRDISLLCPEGKQPGKPKASAKYNKGHFRYEQSNDVYICPAGQQLIPCAKAKDSNRTRGYTLYGMASCQNCQLRNRCTTNKKGRRIKRYLGDDAKDALREVMQHPLAKKRFSQRQGMVEPVFSHLRQVQRLNRFRRKGLDGVKREFGLHLLAYNLSRVVACHCLYTWLFWAYQSLFLLITPIRIGRSSY